MANQGNSCHKQVVTYPLLCLLRADSPKFARPHEIAHPACYIAEDLAEEGAGHSEEILATPAMNRRAS
jgi:hypothetical protein